MEEKTSQTPREKWNVPDWRNEGDYLVPLPENDDEDINQWRWEFLRRDKEYRQDWEKFLELDHPFKLALREEPEEPHFDLPKYPEEYPDRHGHIFYILSKYKLARLLNPAIPQSAIPAFLSRPKPRRFDLV